VGSSSRRFHEEIRATCCLSKRPGLRAWLVNADEKIRVGKKKRNEGYAFGKRKRILPLLSSRAEVSCLESREKYLPSLAARLIKGRGSIFPVLMLIV